MPDIYVQTGPGAAGAPSFKKTKEVYVQTGATSYDEVKEVWVQTGTSSYELVYQSILIYYKYVGPNPTNPAPQLQDYNFKTDIDAQLTARGKPTSEPFQAVLYVHPAGEITSSSTGSAALNIPSGPYGAGSTLFIYNGGIIMGKGGTGGKGTSVTISPWNLTTPFGTPSPTVGGPNIVRRPIDYPSQPAVHTVTPSIPGRTGEAGGPAVSYNPTPTLTVKFAIGPAGKISGGGGGGAGATFTMRTETLKIERLQPQPDVPKQEPWAPGYELNPAPWSFYAGGYCGGGGGGGGAGYGNGGESGDIFLPTDFTKASGPRGIPVVQPQPDALTNDLIGFVGGPGSTSNPALQNIFPAAPGGSGTANPGTGSRPGHKVTYPVDPKITYGDPASPTAPDSPGLTPEWYTVYAGRGGAGGSLCPNGTVGDGNPGENLPVSAGNVENPDSPYYPVPFRGKQWLIDAPPTDPRFPTCRWTVPGTSNPAHPQSPTGVGPSDGSSQQANRPHGPSDGPYNVNGGAGGAHGVPATLLSNQVPWANAPTDPLFNI